MTSLAPLTARMTAAASMALSMASFAAAVGSTPVIPLCPGLTVVTAVSQRDGDYESIKTIESVGDAEVRLKYSAEMKNTDWLSSGPDIKQVRMHRTMLRKDLEAATSYQQVYLADSAETIPETTAIGTSAAVLRALKSSGQSDFAISVAYEDLTLTADRNQTPNYYSYLKSGTIKRVEGPASMSVLVNDVLTDLPAIRAQGELVDDKVEFLFLDDVRNPLTLAFRIGIDGIKPLVPEFRALCAEISKGGESPSSLPGGARCDKPDGGDRDVLRVVKITFRCPLPAPLNAPAGTGGAGAGQGAGGGAGAGASALESELANGHKADVYSIYFSFNSDGIRDESEPTLKEIADILRRHPDWRLGINGHTDSIGGDASNLDLSRRRAEAVRKALATRYGIDASRLATAGFGRSQPKDTNETLEGRARNRRVELMRL